MVELATWPGTSSGATLENWWGGTGHLGTPAKYASGYSHLFLGDKYFLFFSMLKISYSPPHAGNSGIWKPNLQYLQGNFKMPGFTGTLEAWKSFLLFRIQFHFLPHDGFNLLWSLSWNLTLTPRELALREPYLAWKIVKSRLVIGHGKDGSLGNVDCSFY